jgi:hypothetical protein
VRRGGFEGGGFQGGKLSQGAFMVDAAAALPQGFGSAVDCEDLVAAVGEPAHLIIHGGDVEVLITGMIEREQDGVTVVVALHQDLGVVVIFPDLGKVIGENIRLKFAVENSHLLPGGGVQDDGRAGIRIGATLRGKGVRRVKSPTSMLSAVQVMIEDAFFRF